MRLLAGLGDLEEPTGIRGCPFLLHQWLASGIAKMIGWGSVELQTRILTVILLSHNHPNMRVRNKRC